MGEHYLSGPVRPPGRAPVYVFVRSLVASAPPWCAPPPPAPLDASWTHRGRAQDGISPCWQAFCAPSWTHCGRIADVRWTFSSTMPASAAALGAPSSPFLPPDRQRWSPTDPRDPPPEVRARPWEADRAPVPAPPARHQPWAAIPRPPDPSRRPGRPEAPTSPPRTRGQGGAGRAPARPCPRSNNFFDFRGCPCSESCRNFPIIAGMGISHQPNSRSASRYRSGSPRASPGRHRESSGLPPPWRRQKRATPLPHQSNEP